MVMLSLYTEGSGECSTLPGQFTFSVTSVFTKQVHSQPLAYRSTCFLLFTIVILVTCPRDTLLSLRR